MPTSTTLVRRPTRCLSARRLWFCGRAATSCSGSASSRSRGEPVGPFVVMNAQKIHQVGGLLDDDPIPLQPDALRAEADEGLRLLTVATLFAGNLHLHKGQWRQRRRP